MGAVSELITVQVISRLISHVTLYKGAETFILQNRHNASDTCTKLDTHSGRSSSQFRKMIATHYSDVIMGSIASQITGLKFVYSGVYSDADQRKHQSTASLAFVRGIHRRPVNSPLKGPVTRKVSPTSSWEFVIPLNRLCWGKICRSLVISPEWFFSYIKPWINTSTYIHKTMGYNYRCMLPLQKWFS